MAQNYSKMWRDLIDTLKNKKKAFLDIAVKLMTLRVLSWDSFHWDKLLLVMQFNLDNLLKGYMAENEDLCTQLGETAEERV